MQTALPMRWKDVPREIKDCISYRDAQVTRVYREERIVVQLDDGAFYTFMLDDVSGQYKMMGQVAGRS